MESVIVSIKPEWIEKIVRGDKKFKSKAFQMAMFDNVKKSAVSKFTEKLKERFSHEAECFWYDSELKLIFKTIDDVKEELLNE